MGATGTRSAGVSAALLPVNDLVAVVFAACKVCAYCSYWVISALGMGSGGWSTEAAVWVVGGVAAVVGGGELGPEPWFLSEMSRMAPMMRRTTTSAARQSSTTLIRWRFFVSGISTSGALSG